METSNALRTPIRLVRHLVLHLGPLWATVAAAHALRGPLRLPDDAVLAWVSGVDTGTAAPVVLWWLARALAWTLALSTTLEAARLLWSGARGPWLPTALRGVALRAAGVSAVGALGVIGPASASLAQGLPPALRPPAAQHLPDEPGAEPAPTPAPGPGPAPDPASGPPAPPPAATSPLRTHTVQPGEHFWSIAATSLADHLGRTPTTGEVAGYWVRVVAANRRAVPSGDVHLLHPGEVYALPPLGG